MGGCLGPEPPGVTNTYQNPVNPPGSPTWNNQQFPNYGYPSTPSTPHQNLKPYLSPVLPKSLVIPSSNLYLINQIRMVPHEFIEIKVPNNFNQWTQFHWFKQPAYGIPPSIISLSSMIMKTRSFQQKYGWFRYNLQKLRIPWTAGKSDILEVDRTNLLMSSSAQFQRINFHKEVKIVFKEEKETTDAGGLIREWMNLCVNEILHPQLSLFKQCETTQIAYKFNYNEDVVELFETASRILGVVIGKAIFERIPLKCMLNYTILRQICGQALQINDVYSYDKDFYRSWQYIVKNDIGTSLQQNFCINQFDQDGNEMQIALKENGQNIMVDSTNKSQYVTLLIEHYCIKSIEKLISNLKYGIYKIIPENLLSVFEPYELDMIITGKQNIDVPDLKAHTVYTGYKSTDEIIIWFWKFVESLNSQRLEHLIHFVTGNGRVPIHGFKYLQSNRGQYQKFHITEVPFDSVDPYPKSHTCFNRLNIPKYPNKMLFDKYIEYVALETSYFGLE